MGLRILGIAYQATNMFGGGALDPNVGNDILNRRIDVSTVALDYLGDTVSAESAPAEIGDHDNDGTLDLMVKFSRTDVVGLLSALNGYVQLNVSGQLSDGTPFLGKDTIKVKSKTKK